MQRREVALPKRVAAFFDNSASGSTDRSLPEVLDADKLQKLRLVFFERFGPAGIKSTHRVGAVNRLPIPAAVLFPTGLFQQFIFVEVFYEILKRSFVFKIVDKIFFDPPDGFQFGQPADVERAAFGLFVHRVDRCAGDRLFGNQSVDCRVC